MPVLAKPRTAMRDGVRMTLLTQAAEEQFARLSATDRHRLAAALARTVAGSRCRLVTKLAKYRIYHFDVTDTVRVSFRLVSGRACVLHVGTHPEFDAFADRYSGSLPNTLIAIEESEVMKKHNQNGTPAPKVEPANHVLPVVAAGDPVSQAILSLCKPAFQEFLAAVRAKDEKDIYDLVADIEAARTHLGAEIEDLADRLTSYSQGTDERQDRLAATVRDARQGLENAFAGLDQRFATLHDETQNFGLDLSSRLVEFHRSVDGRLDGQEAKLAAVEQNLSGAVEERKRGLGTLEGEIRTLEMTFCQFGRRVNEQLGQMAQTLAADKTPLLVRRLEELAAEHESLGGRVSRGEHELAEAHLSAQALQGEVERLRGQAGEQAAEIRRLQDLTDALHRSWLSHLATEAEARRLRGERSLKGRFLQTIQAVRGVFTSLCRVLGR